MEFRTFCSSPSLWKVERPGIMASPQPFSLPCGRLPASLGRHFRPEFDRDELSVLWRLVRRFQSHLFGFQRSFAVAAPQGHEQRQGEKIHSPAVSTSPKLRLFSPQLLVHTQFTRVKKLVPSFLHKFSTIQKHPLKIVENETDFRE